MKQRLRAIGKVLLAAFVLFHMAAIALYAVPWSDEHPAVRWLRANVSSRVHPYVLSASQWQQWNLFSPDPMRRVSHFLFQYDRDGTWITLRHYKPGMHRWWQHANRFKLYGEFLDSQAEHYRPIVERALHRLCVTESLPPGTRIRLVRSAYIIPKHEEPMPASWWQAWKPEFATMPPTETACPDAETMRALSPFPG